MTRRDSFFVKPKSAPGAKSPSSSTTRTVSSIPKAKAPFKKATRGQKRPGDVAHAGKRQRRDYQRPRDTAVAHEADDDEIASVDDADDNDDDEKNNINEQKEQQLQFSNTVAYDDETPDEKRSRLARSMISTIQSTLRKTQPRRSQRRDDDDDDDDNADQSSGDDVEGRVVAGRNDDDIHELMVQRKARARAQPDFEAEDADDNDDDEDQNGDLGSYDVDAGVEDDALRDMIDLQLDQDMREQSGKLVHAVARQTRVLGENSLWLKGLKGPVTCVVATADFVFAGCKQGSIMQWCASTGRRLHTYRGAVHAPVESGGHAGAVLCLAVSTDGKLLLSGGADRLVRLWDIEEKQLLDSFSGHRDVVTGVAFRRNSHQFFTTSADRTVRIWDGDERLYMDTLFGHQAPVQALAAFSKERCVTVGSDRTLRVWKIVQESQLVFRGHKASIDCLAMLDDSWFVTGSQDGAISMWYAAHKRPHATVPKAHAVPSDAPEQGNGGWVSACAALPLTDLVATGSCDGFVRLWRADRQKKRIAPASYDFVSGDAKRKPKAAAATGAAAIRGDDDENSAELAADTTTLPSGRYDAAMAESAIPAPGFVNGLCFSPDGSFVVAALSREHRLGRWSTIKSARDGIMLTRLQLPVSLRGRAQLFDFESKEAENAAFREQDDSDDESHDTNRQPDHADGASDLQSAVHGPKGNKRS